LRSDATHGGWAAKTITAKREGTRWYAVLSCDDVPAVPLTPTGSAAGIDLGLASFLTTSDGRHIPNPRYLAASTERLTAGQQDLAHKKRGSKAESAGRKVIAVSPRHTSQRCAHCGHTAEGNRVTQAEFRCLACGHQAHADVNAAKNILRAGLVLQEA
jgi:transposase